MQVLLNFLKDELPGLNNLLFQSEVVNDLDKMASTVDEVCLSEIIDGLRKLNTNPNLGQNLGNKHGMDLSEFSKFYVCSAKTRIVYKKMFSNGQLKAEIWTIAARDNYEAYIITNNRNLAKKALDSI